MDKKKRNDKVWKKTMGVCAHCGRKVGRKADRTIDHAIPQALGGTFDFRNLMPLCEKCNKDKGSALVNYDSYYSFAPRRVIEDAKRYAAYFFVEGFIEKPVA